MISPPQPATDPLARFSVRIRRLFEDGAKADIDRLLDALALARGHTTPAEVARFKAALPQLDNPFPSIPGSEFAMERIQRAIERKEKIVILGDYDVDGIISTVLMFEFLTRAGDKPACFIPDRIEDDYGLTQKAADKCIEEHHPALIISVDCGSPSIDVIAGLKARGVDTIVLDHHSIGNPNAKHPSLAHLNPKAWPGHSNLVDEAADLCAGGLVFFFLDYLSQTIGATGWCRDRALILAGIASVVDVMPLVHANRSLVKHSLSRANTREGRALIPGISALLEKAGASEFTVRTYGWVIGPHLNAAGRIAHARIAANLVAARSMATIADGVEELVATNRDRKQVQERVQDEAMKQATELIEACPDRRFLVLYGKDWHPGVVGIVAGRVRERFRLPAIVCGLHPDGGFWKGSARSIGGCDLGALIHGAVAAKAILGGGGHKAAAGVRVGLGQEESFRAWLEEATTGMVWDKIDTIEIIGDYQDLPPGEWSRLIQRAGPFGNASPEPAMLVRQAVSIGATRTLKTNANGRIFGLSFAVRTPNAREYNLTWLGLSSPEDLLAAEALLRHGKPMDFAVRQTMRERDGMTYTNLELAGLPALS